MRGRERLSDEAVATFLRDHPDWARVGKSLVKTFAFATYPAAIAFVVKVGFAAEALDHHPDMQVTWRKVHIVWTTHDAGGITALDEELAIRSNGLAT